MSFFNFVRGTLLIKRAVLSLVSSGKLFFLENLFRKNLYKEGKMNFHYNFRKTEYKKLKEQALYILSTCYQSHREMMDTVRSTVPYMLFRKITNQCSVFLCSTKIFDKLAANLKSAAANKLLKALTDHFVGGSRLVSFDPYSKTGGSEIFFFSF
jgi:hypothetical protein